MTHNMRVAVLAAKILLEMGDDPEPKTKSKSKSKTKTKTKKVRKPTRSDQLVAYMKKVARAVTTSQVMSGLGVSRACAQTLLSSEVRLGSRIIRLSRGVYALA